MLVNGIKAEIMSSGEDHSFGFTPYLKITKMVEDCFAALNFAKITGNIKETIRKEEELQNLQVEVAIIRKRIQTRSRVL